ncbi:MAG: trehalose utilization protein ThuA [Gemmatimonadaceae bacterium]
MSEKMSRRQLLGVGAAAGVGMMLGVRGEAQSSSPRRRVIVWSEGTAPVAVYPDDIRGAVAEGLRPLDGWEVTTATITDVDQGVSQASLDAADVLIWWGHRKHGEVTDASVERIVRRVKDGGMGFIAMHSAHFAKPYKALMGTNCGWTGGYRDDGSRVKVIVKASGHPIARGVKDFELPHTERYGEAFEVPEPEAVVLDGVYTLPDGSEQPSRQALVWTVGKGRVLYFQPGHETYPIFYREEIKQILRNAVEWAAPQRAV